MPSLEARKIKQGTSWRVIYYREGRKESLKIGITQKRIAQQQKAKVEALLASGIDPREALRQRERRSVKLSDLLEIDKEWCKPRRQPHTIELYEKMMHLLMKYTNDIKLSEIRQPLIEAFLQELLKHQSPTTASMALRTLKAIFQRAIDEHNLIKVHPFRKLKGFASVEKRRVAFLTVEEVKKLLNVIEDGEYKRLIQFYAWTGCRRTEALD